MYLIIAREGNYYVLDQSSGLRVSPPLPNNIMAEQFMRMVEVFGPPSMEELLTPSFDWRAWMSRKSSNEIYPDPGQGIPQDPVEDPGGGIPPG